MTTTTLIYTNTPKTPKLLHRLAPARLEVQHRLRQGDGADAAPFVHGHHGDADRALR
jgi:hypothetical protein